MAMLWVETTKWAKKGLKVHLLGKKIAAGAALIFTMGLTACTQNYTTADGTVETANLSPVLLNIDAAGAAIKEGKIPTRPLSSNSKFYLSVNQVNVSGFDNFSPFSVVQQEASDAQAKEVIVGLLKTAKVYSGSGRYTLNVQLEGLSFGSREADGPGTVIELSYSVLTGSGQKVKETDVRSVFHVPFNAAPYGRLRARLQYFGSLENNVNTFSQKLK